VLIAIPLKAYPDLPADAFAGKIVVDAMNYYPSRDGQVEELDAGIVGSSELLARHAPGARVVKAFNTMLWTRLGSEGRPGGDGERLVLFVAGDDEDAKRTVSELIDQIGFAAVDTGSLHEGGMRQQPGSPIYNKAMTVHDAEAALGAG
jgi:hypothetical protein